MRRPHRAGRGLRVLFVPICVAYMTNALATDLVSAYEMARANDPTFAAARFATQAARERTGQARAQLLPSASINGSNVNNHAVTAFADLDPVDRYNKTWSWTFQVSQPILRVDRVYAYREAGLLAEQAQAQFAQAQQELVVRVCEAYFGVLTAQEAINAAAAEIDALKEQLAQVKRGFERGTHAVTDVDETTSRFGLALAKQIAAQNELENREADLEKVTGQRLAHLAALPDGRPLPQPVPLDSRMWMDQARSSHPLVRAQQAALAAAEQSIRKNRAAYLPTLDLVASYGGNSSSRSLTTPDDYSTRAKSRQVGLQLTIPLTDGGGTGARVGEAIANRDKGQADLEAATRQAAIDARQAYGGVMSGLAQIEALNTSISAAGNALKGTRAGYRAGLRINLDVLNAQQLLYAAQKDLAKARYETLLQGVKLKATSGSLTDVDVQNLNQLLR